MPHNKKMGRPLKNDKPLSVDVKVRVDEDTNKRLEEYSKSHKVTKGETIRKAITSFLESNQ